MKRQAHWGAVGWWSRQTFPCEFTERRPNYCGRLQRKPQSSSGVSVYQLALQHGDGDLYSVFNGGVWLLRLDCVWDGLLTWQEAGKHEPKGIVKTVLLSYTHKSVFSTCSSLAWGQIEIFGWKTSHEFNRLDSGEDNLTCQMEHFPNLLDLFHISIWARANRKHLETTLKDFFF